GEWSAGLFYSTGPPDLILALDKDLEQFLLNVAASVPSLVDNDCFLVAILPQLLFEFLKRRRIHRLNVKVTDPAARQLFGDLAPFLDPALVAKLILLQGRDGLDPGLPGTVLIGLVVECDFDLAVQPVGAVQQLPVVVAGLDRLSVDRNQIVANAELDPVLVGRTAFIDVAHPVAASLLVLGQIDSKMARGNPADSSTRR